MGDDYCQLKATAVLKNCWILCLKVEDFYGELAFGPFQSELIYPAGVSLIR